MVLRLKDGRGFSTAELWILLSAQETTLLFPWCKLVSLQNPGFADWSISWCSVTVLGSGRVSWLCCLREGAPQLSWAEPLQFCLGMRNWVPGFVPLCSCPPAAAVPVIRCVVFVVLHPNGGEEGFLLCETWLIVGNELRPY